MDINFELYKVFYYVAKSLSFSEAAEQLFISQSAVSQSIKILEDKIGSRLFVRNTKQVKLTQEGTILFEHIEQAYNFIKTGERSIESIHSLKQGEIRIGASDTICRHYLLTFLKKFNELYPNIKIKIINRTSPRCIELLKRGSVDLAVVNLPEKLDKNLHLEKAASIQDAFIAGNNFSYLKGQKLALAELKNYPILMLEKYTTTRNFIDSFLEKNGLSLTPEIELGSVDLLVEMARIGLGVSLVIKDFIGEALSSGEVFLLELKEEIPSRNLGVLTNNIVPISKAAEKFLELVQ